MRQWTRSDRNSFARRGAAVFAIAAAVLVIALMILIAIPGVRRAQANTRRQACVENLATILAAKEHYALDHNLKPGAPVTLEALLKDGKEIKERPLCPSGGQYIVGPIGDAPTCSHDADHKLPPFRKAQ